jgi:DNA-binding transcriptional LysR family regulator
MNVTLRQLRSILAIRSHSRISAAADAMGLTSPAVTLQLQQLEDELGQMLFTRTRSGVEPTDAGQLVIASAQRIFNELEHLEQRLLSLKGSEFGRIKIGVVSTGKYFAPRIIAAFNARFPGVEVLLQAANRREIIDLLEAQRIDIALMGRPPRHFRAHASLFGDHPLVFVAHPGHPLAKRRDIKLAELADQKFIVRETGSGTRSSFDLIISEMPQDSFLTLSEMDSNETIKQAVMAGLGIAFISGHTIEQEVRIGALAILDVGGTPIRRQWYTVRHADRQPTPAVLSFEEFLRVHGMSLLPVLPIMYSATSGKMK